MTIDPKTTFGGNKNHNFFKVTPEFTLALLVALSTFVGFIFTNQLQIEKRLTTVEVESKNTNLILEEIKDGMVRMSDKIDSLIEIKRVKRNDHNTI